MEEWVWRIKKRKKKTRKEKKKKKGLEWVWRRKKERKKEKVRRGRKKEEEREKNVVGEESESNLIETSKESRSHKFGFLTTLPLQLIFHNLKIQKMCFQLSSLNSIFWVLDDENNTQKFSQTIFFLIFCGWWKLSYITQFYPNPNSLLGTRLVANIRKSEVFYSSSSLTIKNDIIET